MEYKSEERSNADRYYIKNHAENGHGRTRQRKESAGRADRETLDRVREFVSNHPTVYCGTHTPQGYENLEAKRVMDLDNPVPTIWPELDFSAKEASGKYICSICGYVYDPAEHDGVAFEDLPEDWRCPCCKQPKD